MKKELTQSAAINQNTCGDIDEERKEGSLIERIITLLDSGCEKQEIIDQIYREKRETLRVLLLF